MIVKDLVDTDLYKFTQHQMIYHQFPDIDVEYRFKCRGKEKLGYLREEITHEILELCRRHFTIRETEILKKTGHFKESYLSFLLYDFSFSGISFEVIKTKKGRLEIIISGNWLKVMLFEIYLLYTVNELYFKDKFDQKHMDIGRRLLDKKIDYLKTKPHLKFIEFGTRRRISYDWQRMVLQRLAYEFKGKNLLGTSNVALAYILGLDVYGTIAHESMQAAQGLTNIRNVHKFIMDAWLKEYPDSLGIMLTDCITTVEFLKSFTYEYANKFSGLRQDSGDPIVWAKRVIRHYQKLGIDPKDKTLIFSDGLTFQKAEAIHSGLIESGFNGLVSPAGIGTWLSTDVGLKPLNIVMKMTACNGQPVAKISDELSKSICPNKQYLEYLKSIFL